MRSSEVETSIKQRDLFIECLFCNLIHPYTKMISCTTGHYFCIKCVKTSMEVLVTNRKTHMNCISIKHCNGYFNEPAIQSCLPSNMYERYMDIQNTDLDIECACCYLEYPLSMMVSCTLGHLFCIECCKKSIETLIVHLKIYMKCITTNECNGYFDTKTIQTCLSLKGYERYQMLVEELALKQANLEGLEKCPFCPYAVIIENPKKDSLFICRRQGCLKVSCKHCKQADHTPSPCPELLEHSVAEAMSKALIRECPKCGIRYYKTEGCNKMVCVCGQKMCYVCRKPISDYSHFKTTNCPMQDNTVARNQSEIAHAKLIQSTILEQLTNRLALL
ncbi:hypothetical protein BC833DRAFT_647754 [Globomyces pollinis-pini]|nr:hypothetical protein BC833DRAFT_647754 [Globomyces pollinis-pini]